jgi:hypothetical protein
MTNSWVTHVKAFQRKNGISFTEALKTANKTYKKEAKLLMKPFVKSNKKRKTHHKRKTHDKKKRGHKRRSMRGGGDENVMGLKSIGGASEEKVFGGNPIPPTK